MISTYKDDGYHITIVKEKNVKQRNLLLLGSTALISTIAVVASTIVSLFNQTLGVDPINEGGSLLIRRGRSANDGRRRAAEERRGRRRRRGAARRREEKTPTSQGDLADQTRAKIFIHPDKSIVQKDFDLKQPIAATEGDRKFEKKYNQYGRPERVRRFFERNGLRRRPGQRLRHRPGQRLRHRHGKRYWLRQRQRVAVRAMAGARAQGVLAVHHRRAESWRDIPYRIIAKPKATYTDAARTNNVQGSVTLKIVLLASGQVGSITPIKGLPHGLTEQAIAAARQIRFEPKKINGVPVSTTVTFQYGFNIY